MKTIIKAIWCILVLAVSAGAANYTVTPSGGGNYTTMQACADAMSAGDTCTVYAGTYNENVTVAAGSPNLYKTFTVNPSDTVYVQSFTINSHVKIDGFHIQNPSSPNSTACISVAGGSTDYYVTNNNMYACAGGIIEAGSGHNTTHGFIQGNTISYMCSTPTAPNVCRAMTINGDYHLIEHNDVSHVSGIFVAGKYIVVRNNTVHDITMNDCGSNSGNCHLDFMQADANVQGGAQPAQYLLVEHNTITNSFGPNMKGGPLLQAESCSGHCFNAIIRFHTAAHIGTGGVSDDNSMVTTVPGWSYAKSYNNSWVDLNNYPGNSGEGRVTNIFSNNSTNGSNINDIFFYPESLNNFNPYSCDSSTCASFSYGHNLAWCTTGAANCIIHGHTYGSGNFADDPGNKVADPQFTNYAGNDFHLSSTSPAIGAGTYLTTASGSGSNSASLTVADAGYFQDGYGISGVQADWIRIGSSTTVQISSVNYSTNVLALASAVSWNKNDPIYLYKDSSANVVLNGANPDIGAYPTANPSSSPAAPTSLRAVSQ
jgi:hypothetical protein